jgi:hypothetical protein
MGTANFLIGLGAGAYLEIIGPDPDQTSRDLPHSHEPPLHPPELNQRDRIHFPAIRFAVLTRIEIPHI